MHSGCGDTNRMICNVNTNAGKLLAILCDENILILRDKTANQRFTKKSACHKSKFEEKGRACHESKSSPTFH